MGPCRPAPVFDLAVKAPPKAVVPHQSGYARLASATEVRDDVFENARADACAQLASSALRSCFRLKAAAPEVRLLLELCVADRYLLVYPKTERSVFILALRRCA